MEPEAARMISSWTRRVWRVCRLGAFCPNPTNAVLRACAGTDLVVAPQSAGMAGLLVAASSGLAIGTRAVEQVLAALPTSGLG